MSRKVPGKTYQAPEMAYRSGSLVRWIGQSDKGLVVRYDPQRRAYLVRWQSGILGLVSASMLEAADF